MFIDVDKLIFKKLEMKCVDNSNFTNRVNTSYTHKNKSYMLLEIKKLSGAKFNYNHIHSTY